jgi:hypothetical protein
LVDSVTRYADCWATFTGYPIIARFDLEADAPSPFAEAMRVLCLKSAVFELSDGDEDAAELVVSAPVDEMVHAVLAQYTLCQTMTARLGAPVRAHDRPGAVRLAARCLHRAVLPRSRVG